MFRLADRESGVRGSKLESYQRWDCNVTIQAEQICRLGRLVYPAFKLAWKTTARNSIAGNQSE